VSPTREDFDVVVVGFGAAGACAAIEAADAGARVLVLDRFDGGGASARSGGSVYVGGGTDTQAAAGFADDPERMFRYLQAETGGAVSEAVLRAFCTESPANYQWLRGHGLDFGGGFFGHKTTHPPNGYALYYSGNEPQREGAGAPPRGHVPAADGMSGRVLFAALARAARDRGVEVRTHSQARRLLTDGDAVTGVEVLALRDHPALHGAHRLLHGLGTVSRPAAPLLRAFERAAGRTYGVRARAVVIAAGGFIFNRELVARHARPYADCMPLGTPGDDGASIRLGVGAGGAVTRMEECAAWRFIYPPEAFVSGLMVNLRGERFCDESLYGATLCRHIARQPEARAYLVIDGRVARLVREQLAGEERILDHPWRTILSGELNALIFRKYSTVLNLHVNRRAAATLDALERRCALPAGALVRAVAAYNERIARGLPDEQGKADHYRVPLIEPPFRAINCDLGNQLFLGPCITLGGLKTDGLTAQVLREDGAAVPGLFAAGRSAAGVCAGGYVSGLSLADCVFSGRRAGRGAAGRRGATAEEGAPARGQVPGGRGSRPAK
jgi:3-oxo-5alpha-steroid 4-dehydrogenase